MDLSIGSEFAKPVTPKRLNEWLQKSTHLTWFLGKGGAISEMTKKDRNPRARMAIKYFRPHLDTRTMSYFYIETDYHSVDFREKFDGDILDLLEYKILNNITIANQGDPLEYFHNKVMNKIKG